MAGMFDSGAGAGSALGATMGDVAGGASGIGAGAGAGLGSSIGDSLPSASGSGNVLDYLRAGGALAGGAASLASGQHPPQVLQASGGMASAPSPASPRAPMQQLSIPTSPYPTQPNSMPTTLPRIPPTDTQHLADILNALAHIKM